jgi:outer membrane protein TolC
MAQTPAALSIGEVLRLAVEQRDEIVAARAAVRAGEQRPIVASALEDPMVAVSFDHIPFMGGGADVNASVEQRVPLSSLRRERRASALADVQRLRAEVDRTTLDVRFEAVVAFVMLDERRRMAALLGTQVAVAQQIVAAANGRYASGTAPQADVLRAEVEVARLQSAAAALADEVRAAEAMLNVSVGRDPATPVPPLTPLTLGNLPTESAAIQAAVASRPELAASRAVIERSQADVRVMQAMTRPMLSVRTGPAYTMAEGKGWMAMVGVSVPLWREKQRATIAEAQAMRAMSEAELRAMTRMIEGEAASALSAVAALRVRASAFRADVLPRAQMSVESAISAYGAGRVPLVSVIDSLQAQWSLESELLDVDTQHSIARARLARAVGSYEGLLQ